MSHLMSWIESSRGYFEHLGWLGVLLFALVITAAQMVVLPVSPLALATGVIFGFWGGLLTTSLGTGLGVAVNFLVARYLARGAVSHRLARNEKFRLIDAAIGREGWKIVALLRFVPMPFGLANYAYGITAIRFFPYLITSVLTILPTNIFFVWLGSSTSEGMQALAGGSRPRHPFEYVLMVAGLIGFFVALTYIGKIARAAVAKGDAAPARS